MAEDDIERLLRDINGTSGSPASGASPERRPSDEVAPAGGKTTGRLPFAIGAGVVAGAGAFVVGILTPFTDSLDMGFAAATAAFVTALVAGPPRWFSS